MEIHLTWNWHQRRTDPGFWKPAHHPTISITITLLNLASSITKVMEGLLSEGMLVNSEQPVTPTTVIGGGSPTSTVLNALPNSRRLLNHHGFDNVPRGALSRPIGDNVLDGCSNLTSYYISDTMMSVGNKAFQGYHKLETVGVPHACGPEYGANFLIPVQKIQMLEDAVISSNLKQDITYEICDYDAVDKLIHLLIPTTYDELVSDVVDDWSRHISLSIYEYLPLIYRSKGLVHHISTIRTEMMCSTDVECQLRSTRQCRSILSLTKNPPIQAVIDACRLHEGLTAVT